MGIDVKYLIILMLVFIVIYGELMGCNESGLVLSELFYIVGFESYFGIIDSLLKMYFEYLNI